MYAQHHRFQIWNTSQHPYSHDPSEFIYTHPGMPGVTNMGAALDWISAVLYPNQLAAVANQAALPAAGNTINDYRVVTDDGDGKAAGYRWEQREGDVAAKWYKIYDMDWGEQTVLSNFLNITQDVYVYKPGMDDLDDTGTAYIGDLSGQRVYGGASAGTNLLLYANSGDGTGANTGSIFAGDKLSPLVDDTFTLGEAGKRWSDVRASLATIANIAISAGSIVSASGALAFGANDLSTSGTYAAGSLTLGAGSITDSSGAIDFGDENLSTTGNLTADTANFDTMIAPNITQPGALTTAPTAENFNYSSNLTLNNINAQVFLAGATGNVKTAVVKINPSDFNGTITLKIRATTFNGSAITGGPGGILATSDPVSLPSMPSGYNDITFTFSTPVVLTSGTHYALETNNETVGTGGAAITKGADGGKNYPDGEFWYSNNGGTSFVQLSAYDDYFQVNIEQTLAATGVIHAVAGVYGASDVVNADIDAAAAIEVSKLEALTADRAVQTSGTGVIETSAVTATELGYVSGVTSAIQTQIGTKANTALSNLDATTLINSSLFPNPTATYDLGASGLKWRNIYMSGILHDRNGGSVSDTTLTSFTSAVGSSDGQTLFWDNTLERWIPSDPDTEIDHGSISGLGDDDHTQYALLAGRSGGQSLLGSTVAAEFLTLQGSSTSSGGVRVADMLLPDADLGGRNLGSSGLRWVNLYMSGEMIGPRVQNVTSGSLPAASGLNIGRMYYATDSKDLMVDTGVALQRLSQENIVIDDTTGWTGTELSAVYNVSASIEDARKAIWAFYDVSDGYKEIKGAELTKSSTQITVDVDIALPAGTYRLVGIR